MNTSTLPAAPASLAALLSRLRPQIREWRARRRLALRVRPLGDLDEHILRDIGFSRDLHGAMRRSDSRSAGA